MNCVFCKIIKGELPSYTIYEDNDIKCFLNINPISNAHCLIIPKHHYKDIYDIDSNILLKINNCAKDIIKLIDKKLKPDGYQLIQNNGNMQEVKHFHLHIIPNYKNKKQMSIEEVYDILTK